MGSEIAEALGFTWEPGVRYNVRAEGTERALWRFRQIIPGYVFDAAYLEGNPFTFPEVQTLLDGITVGGHKISEERQILNLNAAAHELADIVEAGEFGLTKEISNRLHHLVAWNEAAETGGFRGEGRVGGTPRVSLGEYGFYHPPIPTEPGGANVREAHERAVAALMSLRDPFEQAVAYNLFACSMQFYFDGNKRTSRNMMNGWLMAHGIDAVSIPAVRRLEYNTNMVSFYRTMDGTEMFAFLASCWHDMQ